MTWGEYIDFETMEAKAEAALATYRENTLEVLNKLGDVPDDVVEKVNSVTDVNILKQWFTLAIKSDSMVSFLSQIN